MTEWLANIKMLFLSTWKMLVLPYAVCINVPLPTYKPEKKLEVAYNCLTSLINNLEVLIYLRRYLTD